MTKFSKEAENIFATIFESTNQIYYYRYGEHVGSTSPARLIEDSTGVRLRQSGFDDWTYSIEMVQGGSIGVVHKKKDEK